MRIKEFSDQSGLSADTLRYYEKIGLIAPPRRDSAGHRIYLRAELDWVAFLCRLRETGMNIAAMRRYAALRAEGDATLAERRELLAAHRDEVRARIAALTGNLSVLDTKIATYEAMMSDAKGQDA